MESGPQALWERLGHPDRRDDRNHRDGRERLGHRERPDRLEHLDRLDGRVHRLPAPPFPAHRPRPPPGPAA